MRIIPIQYPTIESFIDTIKTSGSLYIDGGYHLGDLGKIYGYQWRNRDGVDQVAELIDGLKNKPYSRYHIIDSWNKADFREMGLPPCSSSLSIHCQAIQ